MIRYAGAAMMQAVERMYPVFKVIWENAQAFLKNFPTRTAADRREKLGFLSGLVGDSIANVVTDADLARNLQVDRRDITRASSFFEMLIFVHLLLTVFHTFDRQRSVIGPKTGTIIGAPGYTLFASAFSRTPNGSRVSLNRALSVFFPLARVQSREPSKSRIERLGICEPRETTAPRHHHRRRQQGVCPTRGHSAHREGPENWSSTMHRILSRLAGLACLLCVAVRFPTPAERAALVPVGWEPRRDARVSRQNQISNARSLTLFLPPPDRDRPRGLRAPARARHETPAPVPLGVHPRGERARQGR